MNTKADTLTPFLRAYIECALWSSYDESDPSGGEPMDRNYSRSDIAEETLKKMAADCEKFQSENAELLEAYGLSDDRAGHDFWLSRNGHGAGFFDRYMEFDREERDEKKTVCDKLQKICREDWPQIDLYIGDDGQIYGS